MLKYLPVLAFLAYDDCDDQPNASSTRSTIQDNTARYDRVFCPDDQTKRSEWVTKCIESARPGEKGEKSENPYKPHLLVAECTDQSVRLFCPNTWAVRDKGQDFPCDKVVKAELIKACTEAGWQPPK